MRRALALAVLATLIFGLIGPSHSPAVAGTQQAGMISYSGPVPLPEHGTMFGVFVKLDEHNGLDRRTAMTNFEDKVGRLMEVERVYKLWDDPFPNEDDLWSRDLGRTLYLSWNASPRDATGCKPWADIASGVYDTEIDAMAANVISFAAPLFFSFHHEPTTKPEHGGSCGDSPSYIAAWQRIRDRFDAAGVTNATYALTLTAQNFDRGRGDEFYPGDDVIDVISANGYNWFGCEFHQGPWREMDEIFENFYEYGLAKGKPMFIAEYGTGEDDVDPLKKARWWANGAETLKHLYPEIKGVSYFNYGTGGACDRYVDSSEASLASYSAMGADTYFNPPPVKVGVRAANFAFSPQGIRVARGGAVEWTFQGDDHTVTDASGMGLFDSGPQPAGSTYRRYFIGAGIYKYRCSIHPSMLGKVRVLPQADPPSGGVATEFTVTWSAEWAPAGSAFDVQIKRPGGQWSDWLTSQTVNSGTFVPDAGAGTYSFRARYRNTGNGATSLYSPPVSVVVS
jgi:plastocyanin